MYEMFEFCVFPVDAVYVQLKYADVSAITSEYVCVSGSVMW